MSSILKSKKRLGRIRRSKRLGVIVPEEGEEVAHKSQSKTGEPKK